MKGRKTRYEIEIREGGELEGDKIQVPLQELQEW